MGMRQPNIVVIEAAGLFNKMRLKAVGEVVVNLVVSFLFLIVFEMGIYGVLFGTTVSMVSVCIWWEIIAVHKYTLEKSAKRYTINLIGYFMTAAVGCFAVYYINRILPISGIAGLLISGIISVLVYAVLVVGVYGRSVQFRALTKRFIKNRK
jgi:peptidoglycan biosynthesis protein MviN/MurJ (putative lipid II flippase)